MFLFFNDTATTQIYTLSLHDALPISTLLRAKKMAPTRGASLSLSLATTLSGALAGGSKGCAAPGRHGQVYFTRTCTSSTTRSEEHTSELQSRQYLVCRLLLEKKKKNI